LGAPGPSTRRRATPREIEDAPSENPFAPLSRESASRPSAPSTQTKLQDVRKVLREMPLMADYITDTGLAAVLRSGLDCAQDTPPSSLPGFRDERPPSPAVAPIDAQVHTTSVRATEQAARTTEQPPTTLPAATEPAAPVTPPAPRASSTSSLSSAPNNTKSPSPQPRRSKRRGAGRK